MSAAANKTAPAVMVRRAPSDFSEWEKVRAPILEAFAYMHERINPPSSALRLTVESMQADAAKGVLLLAESAGEFVGCVFVQPKDDALYIAKFAVRPTRQGDGIGKKLMAAIREEARERGHQSTGAWTHVELMENQATFARMGFVKTGEMSHEGFDRPTSITMRAPA